LMHEASAECRRGQDNATTPSTSNALAMIAWDRAAALLLGSESPTGPGHLSPYDLGQTFCSEFGTCSAADGVAEANHRIADLLYAGRGALVGNASGAPLSGDCDVLIKVTSDIQALTLVPIIQSTISSAFDLSSRSATPNIIAHAFASSRAVLPLIQKLNPDVALTLKQLLPLSARPKDFDTTGVAVMDAFSRVYEGLNIGCEWIGRTGGYNPCQSNNMAIFLEERGSSSGLSPGALTGIVIVIAGMTILWVAFLYWKKKRQRSRCSTNFSGEYLFGTTPKSLAKNSFYSESQIITEDNDSPFSATTSRTPPEGPALEDFGFDPELIDNSYRSSPKLSREANDALSRILRYGDDATNILPEDTASSDEHMPPDVADPRESPKKVQFVLPIDDEMWII
jgi:hypothetical protein